MYVCDTTCMSDACGIKRRASDTLEQKLQMVGSSDVDALRHWAISPAPAQAHFYCI